MSSKSKKKGLMLISIIVMMSLLCTILIGCSSNEESKNDQSQSAGTEPATKVEFSNISASMSNNDGVLGETDPLICGEKYILAFDFDITTQEKETEKDVSFVVEVKIHNATDEIQAEWKEVNTGNTTRFSFKADEDGNNIYTGSVIYKVPKKSEVKKIKMKILINPIASDLLTTSISIKEEDASKPLKILGNLDGKTVSYEIEKPRIKTPVIAFDSNTKVLTWGHVKYAEKYVIVIDGMVDNPITKEVTPKDMPEGSTIMEANLPAGIHNVYVYAISTYAKTSANSEIINYRI